MMEVSRERERDREREREREKRERETWCKSLWRVLGIRFWTIQGIGFGTFI